MIRSLVTMLMVALIVIAVTLWLAWWPVPIVAFLAGAMLAGRSRATVMITIGAGLAWLVLLLLDAVSGHLSALASLLGHVFRVPGVLLLAATITFVMLLAWSAAVVGEAVRRAVKPLRVE